MTKTTIYKIFYDEASRASIEAPYLPLDNSAGKPGWFELWPILNWIETNTLEEDRWYGFVSPKFPAKIGVSNELIEQLLAYNPNAEVALCSSHWLGLAKWRNVWLQGELSHPGLIRCAQGFFATLAHHDDLARSIGDFSNSVYSNYIIAKPRYWHRWAQLARQYYTYVDHADRPMPDDQPTGYEGPAGQYQMKTFVQERLACWILQNEPFRVVHLDYPADVPMSPELLSENGKLVSARRKLRQADRVKRLVRRTGLEPLMFLHRRLAKAGLRQFRRYAKTTDDV